MATAEIRPPKAGVEDMTVADLERAFGPIPIRRIVLDPPPGEATEEDLVDLHERTKRIFELVDGILVEKTAGVYESWLAGRIVTLLNRFLESKDLGFALGADGMLRLVPGLIRAPDASFVAWDRVDDGRVPDEPVGRLSPNLAVEVLSRSNTSREMERKLDEYFATGVELVWYVEPRKKTVRVYTSRDAVATLTEADALDGGSVLPGFSVKVAELFVERTA